MNAAGHARLGEGLDACTGGSAVGDHRRTRLGGQQRAEAGGDRVLALHSWPQTHEGAQPVPETRSVDKAFEQTPLEVAVGVDEAWGQYDLAQIGFRCVVPLGGDTRTGSEINYPTCLHDDGRVRQRR